MRPRAGSRAHPPPRGGARPHGIRDGAQELTLERVVRPAGPYSLALSTRHCGDATRRVRDGTLMTALLVHGNAELASARQVVDGRVVLRAQSEAGLERLRFSLAIGDVHSQFLRRFADDSLVGRAKKHLRWL